MEFTVYKDTDGLWRIDATINGTSAPWSVKDNMGSAIERAEDACDNYGLDYSHITVDLRGIGA